MTRNDITGDRIARWLREALEQFFGRSSQCGDCGGTRKVGGQPCKVCCPTDDGPEGGNGE